jgi:hypothetical protein
MESSTAADERYRLWSEWIVCLTLDSIGCY